MSYEWLKLRRSLRFRQDLTLFPRPKVIVRIDDRPRWLPFSSGWVFVDDKRVGLLAGGKPRKITLSPGEHTLRVRFDSVITITVEEGSSSRYRCGWRPHEHRRALGCCCVLLLGYIIICGLSLAVLSLLRTPALDFVGFLYHDIAWIDDAFFVFLYRCVKGLTSDVGALFVGAVAFHIMTGRFRVRLNQRTLCYLESE
jgi:hypothetical protein